MRKPPRRAGETARPEAPGHWGRSAQIGSSSCGGPRLGWAGILEVLAEEGRISWRELAGRIGLSLTPTLRRVRRLEAEGVIAGYSVRLDEQRLGTSITMYVQVRLEQQTEEALKVFERHIADAPEVMSCYLMTGEADYILRVVVADLESYQRFMLEVLTRIPGVSHIHSSLAIKSVFRRPAPPIPTAPRHTS